MTTGSTHDANPDHGSGRLPSVTAKELRESPLFKGFEGWSAPLADDVVDALRTGTVIVDTNILLNLYKYTAGAAADWRKIFTALGPRLFIPHQVLLEFWRRRTDLARNPDTTLRARNDVASAAQIVSSKFGSWASARRTEPTDKERELLDRLESVVTEMDQVFDDALTSHNERFNIDPQRDEVVAMLQALVRGGARVGKPNWTPESLKILHGEADDRYSHKIPPGFADDGNNPDAKNGKVTDKKYGDYLLWTQALAEAESSGCGTVVLVTADLKEDWWERRRDTSSAGANDRRPHHLLVEEMAALEPSTHYVQLDPETFLHQADVALDVAVGAETLTMAGLVQKPTDLGIWHIHRWGNVIATAVLNVDGSMRVLAGSKMSRTTAPTASSAHTLRRQAIVDSGEAEEFDETYYTITVDQEFTSPSAAASVTVGYNTSGNVQWANESGVTLGQFLADRDSQDSVTGQYIIAADASRSDEGEE